MIFSVLLLSLVANSMVASAPNSAQKTAQEKYDECVKQCNPNCLKTYVVDSNGDGQFLNRPINDKACVALYQNCLRKCRIDYKHAIGNSQPQTAQK